MSRSESNLAAVADARKQSRRNFLKRTAAIIVGTTLSRSDASLALPSDDDGPRCPLPKSRVVKVSADRLMPLGTIQQAFLKSGLKEGLCRFTHTSTAADAWHTILQPDDCILVKFNQAGAISLGTSVLLASTLVDSLTSAGWAPEQITLLEVDRTAAELRATRAPDTRWQDRIVDFGTSGKDSLTAALDKATAIINVPFLKTHHLTTTTCSLKNLSHGLIRHPARFHADGCDPAIAEIVASEPIRSKLRLNIVNAMKVIYHGSHTPQDGYIHTSGTLLIGTDPVACDAIGFHVLNEVRALRGHTPLLPAARLPRYLRTAGVLGLGQPDADAIQVETL